MSTSVPKPVVAAIPKNLRIGIAAARFNADIVDELVAGCLLRLAQLKINSNQIDLVRVPGAFELPVTARAFVDSGRYDAVICLGAVIRGETPHFEYVAGECARGCQTLSVITGVPIIFGVLTTNNLAQALDRIGGKHGHAGERAAEAAVEMVGTIRGIARPARKANPKPKTRR